MKKRSVKLKAIILTSLIFPIVLTGCGAPASSDGAADAEANHFTVAEGTSDHTCTFSIDCQTILANIDNLKPEKKDFVPSDGIILVPTVVDYEEGDTVFDVLSDVCTKAGIHMEAAYTPLYDSYYIEGINQLYEFDCGELSGWTYSVNGESPNYGCSQIDVHDGDVIEWHYTCDIGNDME